MVPVTSKVTVDADAMPAVRAQVSSAPDNSPSDLIFISTLVVGFTLGVIV
jgi:hypothetical protein